MFGKKRQQVVIGDSWEMYTYTYGEGMRVVISFDVEAAREKEHRGYGRTMRVILYIPMPQVHENGLPVGEVLPSLAEVEERLLKLLRKGGVACRFVGRMTYGGMRELIFQAEGEEPFRACVEQLAQQVDAFKVELREGEGWRFFDKKVSPAPVYWQQISDRRVIDQLLKAGTDPEALHVLDHTLVGEPETLEKIRRQLEADGFKKTGGEGDVLVMSRASPLDLDAIFGLTSRLSGYCAQMGVEYDGWGAAVIADPNAQGLDHA
jgi:regulator of RNase E activity RraB